MADEQERELRWLRKVRDLSHQLGDETDAARLLARILDAAIELSGAERGFLVRAQGKGKIRVEVARGFDQSDLRSPDGQVSRTVIERVVANGRGIVTTGDDADLVAVSSVRARSVRAILAAPMTLRGELVGALYLDHRHLPDAFHPADLVPLATFASQAALALETAELRAQAGAAGERLGAAMEELKQLRRERRARSAVSRASGTGTLVRFGRLVGGSPVMAAVHADVERAARSWEPALILGESGTGKQAVAEEVHARSAWAEAPLHVLPCGGAGAAELEARLKRLVGRGRSTLLLDEVGELDPAAQAVVARLLAAELGGAPGPTGCRVLATSRRDLQRVLREDLHYRLDVLRIRIPPLRQRPEDVEPLVQHFVAAQGGRLELSPEAAERLAAHRWPGNVRELSNEVRRLLSLGVARIEEAHLSPEVRAGSSAAAPGAGPGARSLQQIERAALVEALEESRGNKSRAARLLGIPRSSLHDLLARHGIS